MNSLHKISRLAGVGYLVIFITGIYANFFVLENLIVPDNSIVPLDKIKDFLNKKKRKPRKRLL